MTQPHILLVDDERDIREPLAAYLAKNGLRVTRAEDAAAARQHLAAYAIDLVLLDVMMPGEDGLSLAGFVRATTGTPIILLTAKAEETDRIVGLELGADDYVTKPFSPRELLARIKAVLRRSEGQGTAVHAPDADAYAFGPWILRTGERELVDERKVSVPLSTGEYNLLLAFVTHPKRVLTRDQLLDLSQGRELAAFERSIDNHISRLRRKIEEDPADPKLQDRVGGRLHALRRCSPPVMSAFPRSLVGQMALLLGLALLVAQLINFALILNERQKLSLAQNQGPAITRFAAVAADLQQAPPDLRFAVIEDASRRGAQFRIEARPATTDPREAGIEAGLAQALSEAGIRSPETRAAFGSAVRRNGGGPAQTLLLSARLPAGDWLNARLFTPRPDPWLAGRLAVATLFLYLIVLSASLLLVARLARPLRDLTGAAEGFGGREPAPAVAERGPLDLRRAIHAFNAMNRRVVSLLDEKDRMLGAIGHDLRTPLASLRIRVESVEPADERERLVAKIDEMAATLEDILVLARTGRAREEKRSVDIPALVDALVEDYRALGRDVELVPGGRHVAAVQPNLLRRAIRNLVDNGLAHGGGSVRIAVHAAGARVAIEVRDSGAGLSEAMLARAGEAFYRGEESRSRETGGAGIGLAIVRAVAENHGGELRLANLPDGGLAATLELPAEG
ncbi:MAG: two-component system, OmpR family, response regulator [Sphingomonadales bacterium]|jgi:DNA-binding response OmpR family regulator/signal transduction histidine kinase|nr:two-component system, OmpR family, response regulator [Sphingomonadales bacterium]